MPSPPNSACSWQDIIDRAAAWHGHDLVVVCADNVVRRGPISEILLEGGPCSRFIRILLSWCVSKGCDDPDTSWRLCNKQELRVDVSRPNRLRTRDMNVAKDGSLELAIDSSLDINAGFRCYFLGQKERLARPAT